MIPQCRHLISLADLTDEQLYELVALGTAHARNDLCPLGRLKGKIIGVYFRKTSTRTRTAFITGALRMGADVIVYGPQDLQENTGECIEDTARVLSSMLDAMVVRTAGDPSELRALGSPDRMAVINAMSADEHPTQALADLTTLQHHFGSVEGLRVLYVGEGNNTAVALALGLTRFAGVELHLRTPPGYGLSAAKSFWAAEAARAHGSSLDERHGMNDLPTDIDVIYTTRWETTGTIKPNPDWKALFAPYRVDESLMARYPKALFLHDLPAHRGKEVDAAVIDGERSLAFEQAANKLYSAMAVLEWCLMVS